MNKENSINEKEAREAIYAALKAEGVEVTKIMVDRIMDKADDLAFKALVDGKSIKVRGLGTLEVAEHKERRYKLPDGTTGTAPAGKHVRFKESEKLKTAINS